MSTRTAPASRRRPRIGPDRARPWAASSPSTGCSAPGGLDHLVVPRPAAAAPRPSAAAQRQRQRRRRARRRRLRHRPGDDEGLLRDRLPAAEGAHRRVHHAVPERHLGHPRGPVRGHHAERRPHAGRQPAGPDAAAAAVRAGQGRPAARTSTATPTAFGWDQWPASQLAQLRVAEDGTRGSGPLLRDGPELQHDRRLLQQGARRARPGSPAPPTTLAEFDADLQKAKDAGITPIAQFNGGATGGLAFPLQNLMAAYGSPTDINDWIFQQVRRDHRHRRATCRRPQHLQKWIDAGYFAADVNSMDYADDDEPLHRRREPVHLRRRLGVREPGQADARQRRLLPDPAGRGRRRAGRDVRAADLRHRRRTRSTPTAPRSSSTGSPPTRRPATSRVDGRRFAPDGPGRRLHADRRRGHRDRADPGGRREGRSTDNGAMDFIANATGSIYAKSWTPQLQ